MSNLSDVVSKLSPLVKAYARDMKILIVDDQSSNLDFYKVSFGKYFNVCNTALNGQEALDKWNRDREYYDIIVTDVDMPIMDGLELVKCIREESMEQSIIVITATADLKKNQDIAYYFIDGLLPKPVDHKKLFILLYRVLKKIAEKKDFQSYLDDLEFQLNESTAFKGHYNFIIDKLQALSDTKEAQEIIAMLNTLIGKTDIIIEEQKSKVELSETHEKDLRFSTVDNKLSSLELMEQLDDSIIDKMEDFNDFLNGYVDDLDAIEKQDSAEAIVSVHNLSRYYNEFIDIVNNLVIFPIVSRSFMNLNTFLANIKEEDLVDKDRKLLLTSLLLNVEKDVKKWINTIFFEQTAENIYYFDASFSNGIFEIESIFNSAAAEDSDEYFDDEDLGFF